MIPKFIELKTLIQQLTLKDLIEILDEAQRKTPDRILEVGFGDPHSWRGSYHNLAFEPKENVSIDEMLSDAKSSLNNTFTGYKGGEYKMAEFTDVHLDYYGECHDVPLSRWVLIELKVLDRRVI